MPVIALTANKAKMESLPEEVRNIIVEVGAEWEAQNGETMDKVQDFGLAKLKENGAIIKTLPEEVRVEWANSLAEFPKKQTADAESRGLPGLKVMQAYLDASKNVGHVWPVEYVLE